MDSKNLLVANKAKRLIGLLSVLMVACCLMLQGCSSSKGSSSSSSSTSSETGASSESVGSSSKSDSATTESKSSSSSEKTDEKKEEEKKADDKKTDEVEVPDLVGKNLKDVKDELKDFDVEYLEADGSKAHVIVKSNWRVDEQSLEAGSKVSKNTKLTLKLGHITEEKAEEKKKEAEEKKAEEQANIEYADVTAAQLVDDLSKNAMNAKETYKGGYYRVTGVVANIDASGKYISIDPEGVEFNLTNIQLFLKDEAAKDFVRGLSTGDSVTACGQITDVGEILGYSMDVHRFE